jgi:hypothetical protein
MPGTPTTSRPHADVGRARPRSVPAAARAVTALRAPLLTAGMAAAAIACVGAIDPNEPGHYPTCPFLALTGWFCPGCGSLRALHALVHGDVREALARNPLVVITAPVLLVWWVVWLVRVLRRRHRRWAAPAWTIWALLVLVVLFTVARNLPGGAFLAP